jgi:hypothetical protein
MAFHECTPNGIPLSLARFVNHLAIGLEAIQGFSGDDGSAIRGIIVDHHNPGIGTCSIKGLDCGGDGLFLVESGQYDRNSRHNISRILWAG